MRIKSFGGITFGRYQETDDFPLDMGSALQTIPYSDGAFDIQGDRQFRKPITMRRKHLLTGTAIHTELDALRSLTNEREWLVLETRGSAERGTWAKLVNISYSNAIEQLNYLPIELTFQIADPWLVATAQGWYFDSGSTFDSGLLLGANYSTRTGSGTLTITNAGGGPITRGQITVTGNGANVVITNAANDWSIDYGTTLAIGDTLFINIGAQTATVGGTSVWDNITLSDNQTGMMRLELGANVLTVGNCGAFTYYWTEVY